MTYAERTASQAIDLRTKRCRGASRGFVQLRSSRTSSGARHLPSKLREKRPSARRRKSSGSSSSKLTSSAVRYKCPEKFHCAKLSDNRQDIARKLPELNSLVATQCARRLSDCSLIRQRGAERSIIADDTIHLFSVRVHTNREQVHLENATSGLSNSGRPHWRP